VSGLANLPMNQAARLLHPPSCCRAGSTAPVLLRFSLSVFWWGRWLSALRWPDPQKNSSHVRKTWVWTSLERMIRRWHDRNLMAVNGEAQHCYALASFLRGASALAISRRVAPAARSP
jgi:hypothetical protein